MAWSESQVERCAREGRIEMPCFSPSCRETISPALWHVLCRQSEVLQMFDTEITELKKLGVLVTEFAPPGGDPGPICNVCSCHTFALLGNGSKYAHRKGRHATEWGACHSACKRCWIKGVESQIPESLLERRKELHCISCCEKGISKDLWSFLCRTSEEVRAFDEEVRAQQERLQQVARKGVHVHQFERGLEAGPICPICRDHQWALLVSTCGHRACEHCWAGWGESQISRCLAQRQDIACCFAPCCAELICSSLWTQLCEQSKQISEFESEPRVRQRRRLRSNPLYPAALQINCPIPGCWGIGYLGFDTVQCFICEHQWVSEDPGNAPVDTDVEELMGVKVKRCPKCNEPIEKNGGCDHMTCICKYEFYWSNLQPYRRQ